MSHANTGLLPTECPNCGRSLDGRFCAACGQKVTSVNPTVHDFVHDLTHELLHVDGKIFRSVRLLLTRPGFLSREYSAGRRARYISPIRLYLIFSVVYFGVAALLSTPLTDEDRAELAKVQGPAARLADPEFGERLEAWMPRMFFVLVPAFALIVAALTKAAGRNYPQHLYFAFHTHAAVFAIAALWMLIRGPGEGAVELVADLALFTIVVLYLVAALRTAYGGTWRRAVGRAAAVTILYIVTYVVAMLVIVGSAFLAVG